MKLSTYKISTDRQLDNNWLFYTKIIVRSLFIPIKSLLFYVFCPIFDNRFNKIGIFLKYDFASEKYLFPKVQKSSNPQNDLKLKLNESRLR